MRGNLGNQEQVGSQGRNTGSCIHFRASDLEGMGPCRVLAFCPSASHSGPGVREGKRGLRIRVLAEVTLEAQWNGLSRSLEAVLIPSCGLITLISASPAGVVLA